MIRNTTCIIISIILSISVLFLSVIVFTACSDYNCEIQSPDNLVAQVNGDSVVLSWDSVEDAELYTIYRYRDFPDNAKPVGTVSSASFTDDSVSSGKTYYYYIQTLAYEEGHQCWSSPSVTVSANT